MSDVTTFGASSLIMVLSVERQFKKIYLEDISPFLGVGEGEGADTPDFGLLVMMSVLGFKAKMDQGSHFFGLAKFYISMIFPGFLVNFQVFFHYF